jgi:hypothetical protein
MQTMRAVAALLTLVTACDKLFGVGKVDTPVDGPVTRVKVAATSFAHNMGAAAINYPLTVPNGTDQFLLVTMHIGSSSTETSVPSVSSVTFGNGVLTSVNAVLGTPANTRVTRTEQWQLVAPQVGTHDVIVALSGPALTLHSDAVAFDGVDQLTPVRMSRASSGEAAISTTTIDSEVGDLVVDSVGQGNGIVSPGSCQTVLFVDNVGTNNTLDNSAASTEPGSTPSTIVTWMFAGIDSWQDIVTTLQ